MGKGVFAEASPKLGPLHPYTRLLRLYRDRYLDRHLTLNECASIIAGYKSQDSSTSSAGLSDSDVATRPVKKSKVVGSSMGIKATSKCAFAKGKISTQKDDLKKNKHKEKLRSDIVSPNEIEVTFDDIGALEETKRLIHELVILPVRRPELFTGGLLKPCRGILLFGPPGTGKTMMAKAIAKESGANFINVSLSSIFCKWVGDSEKTVKALFTLAVEVAPTVIFMDEIDSLLGKRTSSEHDSTSRKVKNEFMSLWDGLRTQVGEHVLVLGATNRPFDLDEAIIRRFERRILVDLPCESSRKAILKKFLARENVKRIDYEELALMTKGYTGSDLKILCTTAAYYPLRELLEKETLAKDGQNTVKKLVLRPLKMRDLRQAKKQVAASFSANGPIMKELQQWNNMYGEGGLRTL